VSRWGTRAPSILGHMRACHLNGNSIGFPLLQGSRSRPTHKHTDMQAVLQSSQQQPTQHCYRRWQGGSVAELLACWTQAQKGPGSSRSRDAVR